MSLATSIGVHGAKDAKYGSSSDDDIDSAELRKRHRPPRILKKSPKNTSAPYSKSSVSPKGRKLEMSNKKITPEKDAAEEVGLLAQDCETSFTENPAELKEQNIEVSQGSSLQGRKLSSPLEIITDSKGSSDIRHNFPSVHDSNTNTITPLRTRTLSLNSDASSNNSSSSGRLESDNSSNLELNHSSVKTNESKRGKRRGSSPYSSISALSKNTPCSSPQHTPCSEEENDEIFTSGSTDENGAQTCGDHAVTPTFCTDSSNSTFGAHVPDSSCLHSTNLFSASPHRKKTQENTEVNSSQQRVDEGPQLSSNEKENQSPPAPFEAFPKLKSTAHTTGTPTAITSKPYPFDKFNTPKHLNSSKTSHLSRVPPTSVERNSMAPLLQVFVPMNKKTPPTTDCKEHGKSRIHHKSDRRNHGKKQSPNVHISSLNDPSVYKPATTVIHHLPANSLPPHGSENVNERSDQCHSSQPPLPNQFSSGQSPLPDQFPSGQPPLLNQFPSGQPPLPDQFSSGQPPLPNQFSSSQLPLPNQFSSGQPPLPDQFPSGQPPLPDQFPSGQPPVPNHFPSGQPPLPDQFPSGHQFPSGQPFHYWQVPFHDHQQLHHPHLYQHPMASVRTPQTCYSYSQKSQSPWSNNSTSNPVDSNLSSDKDYGGVEKGGQDTEESRSGNVFREPLMFFPMGFYMLPRYPPLNSQTRLGGSSNRDTGHPSVPDDPLKSSQSSPSPLGTQSSDVNPKQPLQPDIQNLPYGFYPYRSADMVQLCYRDPTGLTFPVFLEGRFSHLVDLHDGNTYKRTNMHLRSGTSVSPSSGSKDPEHSTLTPTLESGISPLMSFSQSISFNPAQTQIPQPCSEGPLAANNNLQPQPPLLIPSQYNPSPDYHRHISTPFPERQRSQSTSYKQAACVGHDTASHNCGVETGIHNDQGYLPVSQTDEQIEALSCHIASQEHRDVDETVPGDNEGRRSHYNLPQIHSQISDQTDIFVAFDSSSKHSDVHHSNGRGLTAQSWRPNADSGRCEIYSIPPSIPHHQQKMVDDKDRQGVPDYTILCAVSTVLNPVLGLISLVMNHFALRDFKRQRYSSSSHLHMGAILFATIGIYVTLTIAALAMVPIIFKQPNYGDVGTRTLFNGTRMCDWPGHDNFVQEAYGFDDVTYCELLNHRRIYRRLMVNVLVSGGKPATFRQYKALLDRYVATYGLFDDVAIPGFMSTRGETKAPTASFNSSGGISVSPRVQDDVLQTNLTNSRNSTGT